MKKRMFLIFIFVTLTCSVFASDFSIKKTGQTKSYNTQGVKVKDGSLKDDGFYQKGKQPHYSRDDKKEIVIDYLTHLMWQDDLRTKNVQKQWEEAIAYCSELRHAGYNDWRLPSLEELNSIVDRSKESALDSAYFKNNSALSYWTRTSDVQTYDTAFTVAFELYGSNYSLDRRESHYVRCVRNAK